MTKNIKFVITRFAQSQNSLKPVIGLGSASYPAGGAYDRRYMASTKQRRTYLPYTFLAVVGTHLPTPKGWRAE